MLAKVFKIDVTICPKCQGSLRKIAAVVDPTELRRYLKHVGLDCDPPARVPSTLTSTSSAVTTAPDTSPEQLDQTQFGSLTIDAGSLNYSVGQGTQLFITVIPVDQNADDRRELVFTLPVSLTITIDKLPIQAYKLNLLMLDPVRSRRLAAESDVVAVTNNYIAAVRTGAVNGPISRSETHSRFCSCNQHVAACLATAYPCEMNCCTASSSKGKSSWTKVDERAGILGRICACRSVDCCSDKWIFSEFLRGRLRTGIARR